jgi:hypothetical protein
MLISKFNKLIRNKFIWAAFAILVSLSMVGFFSQMPSEGGARSAGVGMLFGEEVSREELLRARLFAQRFDPQRGGAEIQRLIDQEAWRRMAMLHYARSLGLRVPDAELVAAIRSDPSFQERGAFSMQRYQSLIRQQLEIPIDWFEDFLREELLLDRMRELLGASVWIPASELDENASRFTDTYAVSFVLLESGSGVDAGAVTEADAVQAYEGRPQLFMVPEQRRVVYVSFPHAEGFAANEISEHQIRARYDASLDRFLYTDPETELTLTRPLEEVADEIRLELAQQEAMALASERAMQVVDELSVTDRDSDISLQRIAAAMGVAVVTSDWFRVEGPPPEGVSAPQAFTQAAFRLSDQHPAQSFSFGVPGTNAVYVMQLAGIAGEYLPAFEDVRDAAFAEARRIAEEAAFLAHVDVLHERIAQSLADGGSFAEAAERESLSITEIRPFVLMDSDPRDIPFFSDLAADVLPLQAGALSPPIRTAEGMVIAHVDRRDPGALEERLAIKPDLTRMMISVLEPGHYETWVNALVAEARGAVPGVTELAEDLD